MHVRAKGLPVSSWRRQGAPSEVEDIEHALVVANEDRGACLEVLLALDYEADADHAACEVVETTRNDIEDVESTADEAHSYGADDAPYRAHAEGREVESDADIVACDGVSVRQGMEGEDGKRYVCEWFDNCSQDGHEGRSRRLAGRRGEG